VANWRPVREAFGQSKTEWRKSATWYRRLPKTSFLFDENVQSNVVRAIRTSGIRVDAVRELGLRGRSDEDVFAVAWSRNQMLVTYDGDFWDDKKFPLQSCAGVLRLPDIGHDLDFFWSIVRGPLRIFARGRDLWFHTKILVSKERRMTLKTWDREAGTVGTTLYWLRPNGSILVYA
jgi:predicted nuclease of predicted toxin-antitoxin system